MNDPNKACIYVIKAKAHWNDVPIAQRTHKTSLNIYTGICIRYLCYLSPSPSILLLLPPSSYPWLPIVVYRGELLLDSSSPWSGVSSQLFFLSIPLSLKFKKQRTPLMKKIQGLQAPHGAASFFFVTCGKINISTINMDPSQHARRSKAYKLHMDPNQHARRLKCANTLFISTIITSIIFFLLIHSSTSYSLSYGFQPNIVVCMVLAFFNRSHLILHF